MNLRNDWLFLEVDIIQVNPVVELICSVVYCAQIVACCFKEGCKWRPNMFAHFGFLSS